MCRKSKQKLSDSDEVVVVVYHVTFVTIGHGLLKKFCPKGDRLRSTHSRELPLQKQTLTTWGNRLVDPYPELSQS